jgi:hypothetical protein
MTTLKKPDGTETSSIRETMEVMVDYIFTEDEEEDNLLQENIRKTIEEPISTRDDVKFSREEVKHTIESFNDKKAPGIDGIPGRI